MPVTKSRLQTLRALANGAQIRGNTVAFNRVDQELQEGREAREVKLERRRNLLQVFHGMRALESGLKAVIRSHGGNPKDSLGQLFNQMREFSPNHPCHLNESNKSRFMRTVRDDRNKIMHEAGSFPRSNREAERMIGEIAACFSLLIR